VVEHTLWLAKAHSLAKGLDLFPCSLSKSGLEEVVVHSPWLAKDNEPASHRLDLHSRVQIVLAYELVESRGPPWV
jgi:hypothetical protein